MPKDTSAALQKKLKQRDNEVCLLQQITNTISYNLNLDEVLREIVNLVSTTICTESCLIYLVQDNTLILKAYKIPGQTTVQNVIIKFGEGITGRVAKQRQPILLTKRAYADKRFITIPNVDIERLETFLSVPIIWQNNIVGVINIQNRYVRHYNKNELQLLNTIATQVGGAISNAKLLSETNILKQTIAARKIIEKAKGLLMKQRNLSENEAYKLMRKKSMDSKKSLQEVAEAILLTLV
ncbi:MAG: ANTAR domain-containing protein [Patescibacteria group bacterium]